MRGHERSKAQTSVFYSLLILEFTNALTETVTPKRTFTKGKKRKQTQTLPFTNIH
jgi:hypothetical protein